MTNRPAARALLAAFCMAVCLAAGMRTAVGKTTGVVSGHISVLGSAKPVAHATVILVSASGSYRTTSDARGFFAITGVEHDLYTATVTAPGLAAVTLSGVTVDENQTTPLSVTLTPKLQTIGR